MHRDYFGWCHKTPFEVFSCHPACVHKAHCPHLPSVVTLTNRIQSWEGGTIQMHETGNPTEKLEKINLIFIQIWMNLNPLLFFTCERVFIHPASLQLHPSHDWGCSWADLGSSHRCCVTPYGQGWRMSLDHWDAPELCHWHEALQKGFSFVSFLPVFNVFSSLSRS